MRTIELTAEVNRVDVISEIFNLYPRIDALRQRFSKGYVPDGMSRQSA